MWENISLCMVYIYVCMHKCTIFLHIHLGFHGYRKNNTIILLSDSIPILGYQIVILKKLQINLWLENVSPSKPTTSKRIGNLYKIISN